MTKKLWIETDYFDNFKCKCGACKRCCCTGWKISVSKKEYYKLLTLDCSAKLADKIESCFVNPEFQSDECYKVIAPNYLGNCPMLDENGLCMIHSELGETALASICKNYPRSFKKVNNVLQANCSNSCEAVVELLLKQDKLTFKTVQRSNDPNISIDTDSDMMAIHIMFTQIIQDRTLPLNIRIKKIVSYLNDNDIDNIDDLACMKQVQNFCKTASINSPIYEDFIKALDDRYTMDEDGVKTLRNDVKIFETNYPKWEIYFENILVNHLYYMNVPYVDERLKRQDATQGLCLVYALMKIICACLTINDKSLDNLAYVLSDIFHLVEHSPFYYNAHILIENETSLLNI